MKDYDQIISEHYREEAIAHGFESTSTMADRLIRQKETQAIKYFIEAYLKKRKDCNEFFQATIAEVGCGNGYTLEVIAKAFPDHRYLGFGHTEELYELASSRLQSFPNVKLTRADIRVPKFWDETSVDVLICQRVLINILNQADQRFALLNLLSILRDPTITGLCSAAIFIESFSSPLENLNRARQEHDLPPVEPQYHNLYLPDDFFVHPQLKRWSFPVSFMDDNFLSVHYFVARAIYPLLRNDRAISRNSELVTFFTSAIEKSVGDYSPLKLYCFEKCA